MMLLLSDTLTPDQEMDSVVKPQHSCRISLRRPESDQASSSSHLQSYLDVIVISQAAAAVAAPSYNRKEQEPNKRKGNRCILVLLFPSLAARVQCSSVFDVAGTGDLPRSTMARVISEV